MGYFYSDENESLEHHGILGQKWGVRRFQRADGTRTPAGKRRERGEYDEEQSTSSGNAQNAAPKHSIDGKKVATAAAIGGAVALGAVLLANPGTRNVLLKYGKVAANTIKTKAPEIAAKTGTHVAGRLAKAGDAMLDAALLSAGGIAISKINEKYADQEGDSEATRNTKQIVRDTAAAGIRSATGSASGSSNSSNKGGSIGKEVSDKIGAPSNKGIDKQSAEYQNLFKGRDADTRATIKSMASAGYDIDQIDKYLNHAEFEDWASQYMAIEIGW